MFVEDLDEDDYLNNKKKNQKKNYQNVIYIKKIENPNYFVKKFLKIMSDKLIDIFNI